MISRSRLREIETVLDEVLLDSVAEFKNYIINETLTTDLEIKNKKGSNKILDYFVDTEIKIS